MIHIIIGTKAQFIKMFPVIEELRNRSVQFNFINLGQHAHILKELSAEFAFNPQLSTCVAPGKDIATVGGGLAWMGKILVRSLNRKWLRNEVFRGKKGICLIHGDTVSTVIGLYMAKLAGLVVAHIEAGLRSYNIKELFPEEIIRLIAMRFSDILFAPSKFAFKNLERMGFEKKSILLSANTSYEVFRHDMEKSYLPQEYKSLDFCFVSIHRMENIFSRWRMRVYWIQ